MKTAGTNTAFAKLLEYEKRSSGFSASSKKGADESDEWSGVTFGLAGSRLTCNIDRISEILPCPQSTPVPGAKPWIIGLANVRGEILTIVDLFWYLTGTRSPISADSRLLTASLNKAPIGLLIDEVFGQRHFMSSDSTPAELSEDSPLQDVVKKQYQLGNETWNELELEHLFNAPEFLNGAAN